jgi:hypothetical protein
VAAFVRIRWSLSIGLGGRFASESAAIGLGNHVGPFLHGEAQIQLVLATISKRARETISRDYNEAQNAVQSMHRSRKLNEDAILLFAISKRFEHVVVALSLLSSAPFELIDDLMHGDRIDALLIPCKAAALDWATVRAILKMQLEDRTDLAMDLENVRVEYSKLTISTAARVIRFHLVREKTQSGAGEP